MMVCILLWIEGGIVANKCRVQQMKNKQFLVTVPRAIGEAMNLRKGDEVEWLFVHGDIVVRKI